MKFERIPKSIQGGCDFSIDKYSSIFLNIAKNRAIELNILEYSEVLNSSMIKLINNSRINVTYTKNTQIKIKFSFEKFKWSGSSRKTNFRLAANTYLNLLKNTSLNSEDLIKNMKSLPLAEILPFVKETANVPDGIGLTEAANQISNVIALSDNLLTMIKTNKSLDLIKATSTNFFSNANSVKGTFSNIILSNSKSAITEKIYVASDVDALQVSYSLTTHL